MGLTQNSQTVKQKSIKNQIYPEEENLKRKMVRSNRRVYTCVLLRAELKKCNWTLDFFFSFRKKKRQE